MNETGRELFLLVSVLALISAIFIFSAWYAPDLFSVTGTNNDQNVDDQTSVNSTNTTSGIEQKVPEDGIIAQSIKGLKQIYLDAVGGLSLLFQPG